MGNFFLKNSSLNRKKILKNSSLNRKKKGKNRRGEERTSSNVTASGALVCMRTNVRNLLLCEQRLTTEKQVELCVCIYIYICDEKKIYIYERHR